jgi:SOS-response transcriptional repressor LexA
MRQVASRAGISHPYLSDLEKGNANRPSPEVLKKLAEVFSVPVSDLMIQAGYMDAEPTPKKTVQIPIKYECEQKSAILTDIGTHYKGGLELDYNIVESETCFAIKVNCDHFNDVGVGKGDIVIVSVTDDIKSGDMVVVQCGEVVFVKKIFFKENDVILSSIKGNDAPIITSKKSVGILGKITKSIKNF